MTIHNNKYGIICNVESINIEELTFIVYPFCTFKQAQVFPTSKVRLGENWEG
jgi:hypothetical protein